MQTYYDYKKYAILYVDDEEHALKYFEKALNDEFRILLAPNAEEGFRCFEENKDELGILITDQRMPGEKGVQLLEKARQIRPRVIRILMTAFSDFDAVIEAVNSGAIYKYVVKPWDVQDLKTTLRHALQFFIVQRERDHLVREKISVLHRMVIADRIISLGVMATGIGHHFRNALQAVRTFLDLTPEMLVQEDIDVDALRHPSFWSEFYERVQDKVEGITSMLDELAVASRKPDFAFATQVRLNEVVAAALQEKQDALTQHNISVVVDIPDSLPSLRVERETFGELFKYFLDDELVNLPDGSQIEIEAREAPESSYLGQPHIEVEIRDNGPGLPEEALRSIFDPFVIRPKNPHSFAINLLACYFIIYHHGGLIEVTSSDESGLAFKITLPLDPSRQPNRGNGKEFISHVLANEAIWERLQTY